MREDYLIAMANLVNGSLLGYEDRSRVPEYEKKVDDYVDSLEQENQKYKEVIDNIKKIIIDNSYNELYECFNELREERVIEIVNVLDIKKDMLKRWNNE